MAISAVYEKLMKCLEGMRTQVDFEPEVALVLESGPGDYAEEIGTRATLNYHDIEGFLMSMIPGRKGRFVSGYVGKVPVVTMQRRVHFYEGYPIQDVMLPVRLTRLVGAKVLFLINTAGSVNENFHAGDFILINDQTSTSVPPPLIGENIEKLRPRLPDMNQVCDKDLWGLIKTTAGELQIPLQKGIYIQSTGSTCEPPAEVWMCRTLGVDAVGVGTACKALAANHMEMKICDISFISNLACGVADELLSYKEVREAVDKAVPLFKKLVTVSIEKTGIEL